MINLFDNYVIDADEYGYSLAQIRENKKPDAKQKTFKRALSYHKTVADALQAFYSVLCRKSVQSEDMDIQQAIEKFTLLEARVADMLSTIKGVETLGKGAE
jgi:hypothetical protein